jgi:hypothetical protein
MKKEVVDDQPVVDEGSLQSLDGISLGAHASKSQSVLHRSNRDADFNNNNSFVTAASSDAHTADNQRFIKGQTSPTQETTTQPKVYCSSTESIEMDMPYGAELAEILNLYNVQRINASGMEKE